MMLADTLYRVSRQPGLHLLQRRAPRHAQWLTSWRLILEPDRTAKYSSKDEEAIFVLQEGTGSVAAADIRADVSRSGVFSERATALYLPPGVELTVSATTRLEAIVISTPVTSNRPTTPVLVRPSEVKVNLRGKENYSREVHDILVDDPVVQRLMVGETFNPAGHWSSYPPHKHDGADGEARLEEVYHFRIEPPNGFGHQELYTAAGEALIHRVRNGDTVLLPYGYHPVSAPPGYRLYYLWALAGERRVLKPFEDPEHRWIHEAMAVTGR